MLGRAPVGVQTGAVLPTASVDVQRLVAGREVVAIDEFFASDGTEFEHTRVRLRSLGFVTRLSVHQMLTWLRGTRRV